MSALDPSEMRAMETACAEHDALMREAAVAKVIRKVHAPEPEPKPAPRHRSPQLRPHSPTMCSTGSLAAPC
jgi:hypothetical protein